MPVIGQATSVTTEVQLHQMRQHQPRIDAVLLFPFANTAAPPTADTLVTGPNPRRL